MAFLIFLLAQMWRFSVSLGALVWVTILLWKSETLTSFGGRSPQLSHETKKTSSTPEHLENDPHLQGVSPHHLSLGRSETKFDIQVKETGRLQEKSLFHCLQCQLNLIQIFPE